MFFIYRQWGRNHLCIHCVTFSAERCRVEVLHKWRDSFSTMEGKGMAAKKNSKHKVNTEEAQ